MRAKLTMLIPNYNRADTLSRLLRNVYDAIKFAHAQDRVEVLVVDDYSEQDMSSAVAPYLGYSNFAFSLQNKKCGNAETAFLAALAKVTTEYVWLLGNDDQVMPEGVQVLLRVLDTSNAGFVLLNPRIVKESDKIGIIPITATASSVVYERTEDLFMDFGFVTSTTTFSCLVMKVNPVREFHRRHRLTQYGTVYSHTFTIFGALRENRGVFLATPIVSFTHNERLDEQRKLQKQAPAGIWFYHQSLGLARLIRECANAVRVAVEWFGSALEDEIDKDSLRVVPTRLAYFLAFFFLEQLFREQGNVQNPRAGFGHLVQSEVEEITDVIRNFGDDKLKMLCDKAVVAFAWQGASPQWKMRFLRNVQSRLRTLVRESYEKAERGIFCRAPRKVVASGLTMMPLHGIDGGRFGDIRRGHDV